MRPIRALMAALTVSFSLALAACEPTPAYLEKWANREGSEEMFARYLRDPDVSHEVRVTALRLLLEQWDYSASLFREDGGILREIPDAAERDATILDALPRVRELYAEEANRVKMRDVLFTLRPASDSAEVRAAIDETLLDWLNNHWEPCVESASPVSPGRLVETLGQAAAEPRLVRTIAEGGFNDLLCQGRTVDRVEWLAQSDALAQAYVDRWRAGIDTNSLQLKVELVDHMLRMRSRPAIRQWMFAGANDPSIEPEIRNLLLEWITREEVDGDRERIVELLRVSETYARWSAFELLVNRGGSDGLELALTSLPSTGEYGFYRGEVLPNGFRSVAENVVCPITRLQELGDNARAVFQRHIADANPYVQVLAIECLKRFGDSSTIARLTELKTALGRAPVAAPRFGEGVTVQSLIDETITAIQTRIGAR